MTQTVGVIIEFVHRNAHKCLMGIGIFLNRIVGIIGGNDLDTGLLCDLDDLLVYAVLISDPVTHNFQVKIFSKEIFVPQGNRFCLFIAFGSELKVAI